MSQGVEGVGRKGVEEGQGRTEIIYTYVQVDADDGDFDAVNSGRKSAEMKRVESVGESEEKREGEQAEQELLEGEDERHEGEASTGNDVLANTLDWTSEDLGFE